MSLRPSFVCTTLLSTNPRKISSSKLHPVESSEDPRNGTNAPWKLFAILLALVNGLIAICGTDKEADDDKDEDEEDDEDEDKE